MANRVPVIGVGASAGGVSALASMMSGFPADLPAAVLVVLHIAPSGPSLLPTILSRSGVLPATHAVDGEPLRPGHVYVAPPDRHLELLDDHAAVTLSPKENGMRPAVDVLFRSIARARTSDAVAVVLSGTLDDGTAGLLAVRAAGGHTIVQNPDEAMFPGMPRSAVRYSNPEFVCALDELPALAAKLVHEAQATEDQVTTVAEETDVSANAQDEGDKGPPSEFTCPACGGTLFEKALDNVLQFRCRVGHGYTSETLLAGQQEHLEGALYASVVALEEHADLSRRMARRMEQSGSRARGERYWKEAEITEHQASIVRAAIAQLKSDAEREA